MSRRRKVGRAPSPEETVDLKRRVEAPFRWGPLLARERLGAGSFGEVYRAKDPALDREVALKLAAPRSRETPFEMIEEARRLARVRHPNVVTVHGADIHDGRPGIWMDLIRGETLERQLSPAKHLDPARVAEIGTISVTPSAPCTRQGSSTVT